jgi:tetratricopeptide (TPR) repeat protein
LFAWCCVALQWIGHGISEEEAAEGARFARQAIDAGQEDPDALAMGGWGIFLLAGALTSGLNAIERALVLNPNFAFGWSFCGWPRACLNRPAQAIEALQQAMRLSPFDPQHWAFYGGLALAHLVAGRHQEAVEWADLALHEQTRDWTVMAFKAAACGHLDRLDDGRSCVTRMRELRPGLSVANLKVLTGSAFAPEVLAVYTEGLRKAGLPEE